MLTREDIPDDIALADFCQRILAKDLESVRLTLLERCALGPSQRYAEELVSRERWSAFVYREVFDTLPWLADSSAMKASRTFFGALKHYIAWTFSEDSPGSERFLEQLRAAFRELRDDFLPELLPALFVRHWMGEGERQDARDGSLRARDPADPAYRDVPWRTTPQPLNTRFELDRSRRGKTVHPSRFNFKSVIFQRGALLARGNDVQKRWITAHSRFLLRLMALIPVWRWTLLHRARTIAETPEPTAAAGGQR